MRWHGFLFYEDMSEFREGLEGEHVYIEFLKDFEHDDGLSTSIFFLSVDFRTFKKAFLKASEDFHERHGKYHQIDLVFLLSDLGTDDFAKVLRLRQLKALLQDSMLARSISRITVKGSDRAEAMRLEANVFTSGVNFEQTF